MTNEARLKTAIDYLESEVEKDDIFIVDSFEKDFSRLEDDKDAIIEVIIEQLSEPHDEMIQEIYPTNYSVEDSYMVNADYGIFNEIWHIEIVVKNDTTNKFDINIVVRAIWDDDEPVEYREHQQYLKEVTKNFLSILGLKIDKRLGSLYFLKMDWRSILKI